MCFFPCFRPILQLPLTCFRAHAHTRVHLKKHPLPCVFLYAWVPKSNSSCPSPPPPPPLTGGLNIYIYIYSVFLLKKISIVSECAIDYVETRVQDMTPRADKRRQQKCALDMQLINRILHHENKKGKVPTAWDERGNMLNISAALNLFI